MLCALALAVAFIDFNLAFLGACGRLWEEAADTIRLPSSSSRRPPMGASTPATRRAACSETIITRQEPVEVPEMYRAKVMA